MTDAQQPADRPLQPAAGYHPDPAGGPTRRWWDGYNWTDAYEPGQWSTPVDANGRPVQPPLPEGTRVDNGWAWAFALLPLVGLIISLIQFQVVDFEQLLREEMQRSDELFPATSPLETVMNLVGWVMYAAAVVFAFLDHRALRRVGIVRPFHWAWAFLLHIPYAIGRGVVLHRRVGRGLAPMWVYLALQAVSLVVSVIIVVNLTQVVFSELGNLGLSTAP